LSYGRVGGLLYLKTQERATGTPAPACPLKTGLPTAPESTVPCFP